MGSGGVAPVDDSSQPDWMKAKSLREIETIRETKKRDMLNHIMGVSGEDSSKIVNVIPGHLTFLEPLTLVNDSNSVRYYKVEIVDPDRDFLGVPELELVHDESELRHWVRQNKLPPQAKYNLLLRDGELMLGPKEQVNLLLKFLTKREVSMSPGT